MKNILTFLVIIGGAVLTSCGAHKGHANLQQKDGKAKLEYLIEKKKGMGMRVETEQAALQDEQALVKMSTLTYEMIDSVLVQLAQMHKTEEEGREEREQENAAWDALVQNGTLLKYEERMKKVRTQADLKQVIADFPFLAEKFELASRLEDYPKD